MKKLILIALLVVIAYGAYTLFIKATNFTAEKVSFQYNNGGIEALADSLSQKK